MEPVETDEEEGTVFSLAAHTECCKYKYPGIVFPCPEVCCSEEREGWREEEEEKEEKEEEDEEREMVKVEGGGRVEGGRKRK